MWQSTAARWAEWRRHYRGGRGVERDKSFELQRTRERQVHEFQSKRLVLRPPDCGAFDGQGLELFR